MTLEIMKILQTIRYSLSLTALIFCVAGNGFAIPISHAEATHTATKQHDVGAYDEDNRMIADRGVVWSTENWNHKDLQVVHADSTFSSIGFPFQESNKKDQWSKEQAVCNESFVPLSETEWRELYLSDYYSSSFIRGRSSLEEVEEKKVTVNNNPVPTSSNMFFFGAGLAGLATLGRRRKK